MTEDSKINPGISNPLVSIITIVYNGEKHIAECINSIINQSYTNIQYIVIDGQSTDGSMAIINSYSSNIDIIVSEKDRGISDAFNKGIERASGQIIGLLNSDDLYSLNAVQDVVDTYINNNGQSGVYYGDIIYFDETKKIELIADASKLWKVMSIFHPATFVTKDVYDRFGGFSEDYKYAMDCELVHRFLFNKVPFIHVSKTLASFRLAGTSDKNYIASHKEFYRSVKTYNYKLSSEFYLVWSIFKKMVLHTRLGSYLNSKRELLSWILAGKMKTK